ncbi:MAG: glycosyltransferase, partial [Bacteroidia bacterium]|nr:glycosyltransferase [Bacteroidia bacterium]
GKENCTTVRNFCNYNFFKPYVNSGYRNLTNLFYIGIVLENRGILEIAKSVYLQKQIGRTVIFHCVGELYSDLDHKIKTLPFYSEISNQLVFHGRLPLDEGYALSVNMGIGLCIIHPMKNSIESYPTKLFEYMASGLPVIISDFDLYKSVVETSGCGICVDPLNPIAISNAITYLNEHPEEALKMGMKGRIAAEEYYNWDQEKVRLLSLYEKLST